MPRKTRYELRTYFIEVRKDGTLGRAHAADDINAQHPPGEPQYVVCLRVGTPDVIIVPHSIRGQCAECRSAIWVAPDTVQALAVMARPRLLCLECLEERLGDADAPRADA